MHIYSSMNVYNQIGRICIHIGFKEKKSVKGDGHKRVESREKRMIGRDKEPQKLRNTKWSEK